MQVLYYILELKKENTAPVDSFLAIIGPAGTDVSGIAANYTAVGAAVTAEAPKAEEAAKVEAQPEATSSTQQLQSSNQRFLLRH